MPLSNLVHLRLTYPHSLLWLLRSIYFPNWLVSLDLCLFHIYVMTFNVYPDQLLMLDTVCTRMLHSDVVASCYCTQT